MTQRLRVKSTIVLVTAVLLNYVAQIPYYLHQYYIPHHLAPGPGVFLLGITLAWFLVGYLRYVSCQRFGYSLLLSFLLVQVLFYGHSILLGLLTGGGAVAQMRTQSHFLFIIFGIGYINFLAAAYYTFWLIKHRHDTASAPKTS